MDVGKAHRGLWCVLGDFNVVTQASDKIGGRPIASSSKNGLLEVIDQCGLIDLGFSGHQFTWNNHGGGGHDNIQQRLDKGYANDLWRLQFPHAKVEHLVALKSDHNPLLLHTNPKSGYLARPFRFESMWTLDPKAGLIIQDAWAKESSVVTKLKNTKVALKE